MYSIDILDDCDAISNENIIKEFIVLWQNGPPKRKPRGDGHRFRRFKRAGLTGLRSKLTPLGESVLNLTDQRPTDQKRGDRDK